MANFVRILIGHIYLSGMWFSVAPSMDTKKASCALYFGGETWDSC